MMGATLEHNPPNPDVFVHGASLRRQRTNANLSITQVGEFYRKGVSKQRILNIEKETQVYPDVVKDFRAAIQKAVDFRALELEALSNVSKLKNLKLRLRSPATKESLGEENVRSQHEEIPHVALNSPKIQSVKPKQSSNWKVVSAEELEKELVETAVRGSLKRPNI